METELKESWAVVVCKCNEIDRKDALEKWFSCDVYDTFEKCLLSACHQNKQDLYDEVFLHPNSRAIDLMVYGADIKCMKGIQLLTYALHTNMS